MNRRTLLKIHRKHFDQDDVEQEAAIIMLRRNPPRPELARKNACISLHRHFTAFKRNHEKPVTDKSKFPTMDLEQPYDSLVFDETLAMVRAAIGELNQQEREAITARYLGGPPYTGNWEAMTVSRAIKKLRKLLNVSET